MRDGPSIPECVSRRPTRPSSCASCSSGSASGSDVSSAASIAVHSDSGWIANGFGWFARTLASSAARSCVHVTADGDAVADSGGSRRDSGVPTDAEGAGTGVAAPHAADTMPIKPIVATSRGGRMAPLANVRGAYPRGQRRPGGPSFTLVGRRARMRSSVSLATEPRRPECRRPGYRSSQARTAGTCSSCRWLVKSASVKGPSSHGNAPGSASIASGTASMAAISRS